MQEWPDGAHFEETASLAAVAEHGSFARAAAALGRDPSVVSRRVSALERRLGVRLLERTTRRLSLTEAGAALARQARAALAALAEAEEEASALGGTPRGLLRLALPGSFGRMWVAPLLPGFLAAHPEVRVDARFSNRYVDLVAEGFDAAVRVGTLPDSGLVARRVATHRRVLCAAPAYLAARGVPAEPRDLERHACLGFTWFASHPDWSFAREGRRVIVRAAANAPLTADDGEALVHAAVAGVGIMLASDWLVGRELGDGRLVPLLEAWTHDKEGAVHAVVPSGRLLAGKTRAFLDWIAARFAPVPPWRRWAARRGATSPAPR
jgi:DNA-binding transcriptional LysR family regulator